MYLNLAPDDLKSRDVRLFVIGVAIMLLGVGCSSSSSSQKATTSTTGAVTSSTVTSGSSTTGNAHGGDQAVADATTLTAAELPGAWTPGPPQPNNKSGDAQTSRCLGIPNSDTEQTAYAGSPVFKQNGTRVFTQTTVYTSIAVVQSDIRGGRMPQLASCIAQNAKTIGGAKNVQITKVALPTAAGGVPGFRLTGSLDLSSSGGPPRVLIDQVALAKGRIEISIGVLSSDSALPAGLMDRVTAVLAQRLNKAAG